jgi:hypothetical protein
MCGFDCVWLPPTAKKINNKKYELPQLELNASRRSGMCNCGNASFGKISFLGIAEIGKSAIIAVEKRHI